MSSFIYFLRESLVGFKRNLSTAIGSVITIFLSLLIIGVFLLGGVIVDKFAKSIEDQVTIKAYIADGAEEADITKLMDEIKGMDNIKNISFTSKDQALEKFKTDMSSSPEIIDQLDGQNPLPASIDIEMNSPKEVEYTAQQIKNNPLFQKICDESDPDKALSYGKKTADKLFAVTNFIRLTGIGLVALLIFIAMVFINNTIRLSILARRKEIAIMRLVGASNGFIRGPFFMESAIHSLIGSLLTILVLELIRVFALPMITGSFTFMAVNVGLDVFLIIYVIVVAAGLIIGLTGSALAMRKYLNV